MDNLFAELRIKKLDSAAQMPVRANLGDVGYDCVAIDNGSWSEDKTYIEYRTGLAMEIPHGYHVELFPRSSISKYDLMLANSIGLIDRGYRNEIKFRFKYIPRLEVSNGVLHQLSPIVYKKGEKIGQMVIRTSNEISIVEVDELSVTQRNMGGFGSSGK